MSSQDHDTFRRLRGTVRMLSFDAEVQIEYLKEATRQAKYQVLADDIATEFDCWFKHSKPLADRGFLSAQTLAELTVLSNMLATVDSNSEHWTAAALATSPLWVAIREQARIALASIDDEGAQPAGQS